MTPPASTFSDSKQHYIILDALRGIAAVLVLIFHVFETFALGDPFKQIVNHGYLAVDFFFMLSGYVIGYAYDDRWNKMSLGGFFKRRLIRLHPMIIMGMITGAIMFYFQASDTVFPSIAGTPVWQVLLTMLIGFTLIPLPPSLDIRGWTEMHPLDGPAWSLFFEYIGNILYALALRKMSNKVLAVFVAACAILFAHLALTKGDVIGGWSFTLPQLHIGFARLLFPFAGGLLLSRVMKPWKIKGAFAWSSLLLITVLSLPRFGTPETVWINGLYETIVVVILFPLIVQIGASSISGNAFSKSIASFLGEISYPLYITHYTFIYTFTAWVVNNKVSLSSATPMALVVIFGSIIYAYLCLKFYDIPVRKWLTKRFSPKISNS